VVRSPLYNQVVRVIVEQFSVRKTPGPNFAAELEDE